MVLHALVLLFFVYNWFGEEFRPDRIWFFLMYAVASVFVTYYLMPKFLYPKKYVVFFGAIVLLIAFLIGMEELVLEPMLYPDTSRAETFPGILPSLTGVLPIMTILSSGKFAWDSLQKRSTRSANTWKATYKNCRSRMKNLKRFWSK